LTGESRLKEKMSGEGEKDPLRQGPMTFGEKTDGLVVRNPYEKQSGSWEKGKKLKNRGIEMIKVPRKGEKVSSKKKLKRRTYRHKEY